MALSTRYLWHWVFSKEFRSVRRCNFLVQLIVTTNAAPVVWSKCVQGTFLWSQINICQHWNSLQHLWYICYIFQAQRVWCWMRPFLGSSLIWFEDMIDHRSYARNLSSCEIKAWKNYSGLNGIQTHDLCDTGAVLYQLSYQATGSWSLCEFVIHP